MKSKQFAWVYLIQNGVAGCKPSFYGGYDVEDKRLRVVKTKFGDLAPYKKIFLKEINEIGVDWDKTEAPESDKVAQFTDTFHDPEYKEMMMGVLVLKNGLEQHWMDDEVNICDIFDMMSKTSEYEALFKLTFGENGS